jgi:endothelin-converting enzyme/putative endopeptidase
MRTHPVSSLVWMLLASCAGPRQEAAPPAPAAAAPTPPPLPAYAVDLLAAMDPKANACDDFYRYACGNWLDTTPLPADKPAWARSFSAIRDRNLTSQRAVLEAAATATTPADPGEAKLGAFFGACMDEAKVDAAGTTALTPWIAEIDGAKDLKGAMQVAGHLTTVGVGAFVAADVYGDFKDPTKNILHLTEGGLGLPDRDYYLRDDAESKTLLAAYEAHVAEMLGFAGVPAADAAKQAKAVVAFETAIATAWVPRAELRDPDKIYHKIDRSGLSKLNPKLHWEGWLAGMGAADAVDINLEVPDVYTKLEGILVKTDIKTVRAYLKWQLVHSLANHLAKPIFDANFAFMGQKVVGQKEPEPRWKRCVATTDGLLGELSGQYFVKDHFPGDSKTVALTMIEQIEGAFGNGLGGLAWMDDPTRERALGKMKKIINKIGYPDKWRDYTALQVSRDTYTANVLAGRAFEAARVAAKIGKPVDRTEWYMSPPTVNAYYDPSVNEIVFPAGILQAPFFDHTFPAAMNYGAMGMVMGHELTHGFDDQGRKFDGDGRLSEWWAPEVSARFDERTACVSKQYSGYQVAEGLNVNGALTLGENIADIGGLREAYRAYKAQNAPPANVPGLTDDQLFFVAAAQSWCTVESPEYEKMLVLSNPHSPSKFRVTGPMSDSKEFAEAFGCAEGSTMHPKDACEVW